MSGDVTTAIERLRAPIRTHDGDYHSWEWIPGPDDVLALLDEVERLRAGLTRMKDQRDRCREASRRGNDSAFELCMALAAAEDEVERLRAERESLHSDETRAEIKALVSRQARALGDGSITPGVLATLVMNLLSAGSEADQ